MRERRDELFSIADYLLAQLDRKYKTVSKLHPDCSAIFEHYEFPGNIRELRNGLERA